MISTFDVMSKFFFQSAVFETGYIVCSELHAQQKLDGIDEK